MKITNLKINRMEKPTGFALDTPQASYVIEECQGKSQKLARIVVALDEAIDQVVYDSGENIEIDSIAHPLNLPLEPCTRYYWKVYVTADNGEQGESDVTYFETGKMDQSFEGNFIACENSDINCDFQTEFLVDKVLVSAKAYVCGLGLYECYINGKKVGDEYLTPYCNAYDQWIQYQTYDVTDSIVFGMNKVKIYTGDGWYKGTFGFEGGQDCIYGEKQAVLCNLVLTFSDGTKEVIATDKSWSVKESKVRFSDIYNGEVYDANFVDSKIYKVVEDNTGLIDRVQERLSLPVRKKEVINPIEIIHTPTGETVLDMGQNMVGWISFTCREPKGTEVKLQHGEILQQGNFYRENLREAKAEYRYISDGIVKKVRPHFTFYGFRYVKLTGFTKEISLDDFEGWVLYSDMEQTGAITTSNKLVNQLISNALWGQKDNFLDIPTDCPQRDERMGWTGDAQVFAATAAFQMDVYAFFKKYGYDMGKEQEKYMGNVPMVIPSMGMGHGGSSVWADAATIIPWTMYLFYGDKTILKQQYNSMKSWVDYIRKQDEESGNTYLWTVGFHFGDWLAMDGDGDGMPTGGTEIAYISSCYYYYSTSIMAKTAKVLGKGTDQVYYEDLAHKIKKAIVEEYFTATGRLALQTQTAYILALQFDLVPEKYKDRISELLAERLAKDKTYIKTGFVGTPFICRVLSEHGYNDLAYTLLLNRKCPSWLYPVLMGATTIWERWNSVLENGAMNPEGMNSLNHYAYGSIVEWMFRNMLGLNPKEEAPGFRKVRIAPQPDYRIKEAKGSMKTAVGTYEISWKIAGDSLDFGFKIPFGATAEVILPDAPREGVFINGTELKEGYNERLELTCGAYEICYVSTVPYKKYYTMDLPIGTLLANPEVKEILQKTCPAAGDFPTSLLEGMGHMKVRELMFKPFFKTSEDEIKAAEEAISNIKMEPDRGE